MKRWLYEGVQMPKAIDLTTVDPATAARILRKRADKKREYERKRDVLLARNKAWRDQNLEAVSVASATWRAANPQRVIENHARWYRENRDHALVRARRREVELTDGVVRSRVSSERMPRTDIPQETIPAFRTVIRIRRLLKLKKTAKRA